MFQKGDSVELLTDKNYTDVRIPKGSKGIVMNVVNFGNWTGCYVQFTGYAKQRLLHGRDLRRV
jgi:hypothetical protein